MSRIKSLKMFALCFIFINLVLAPAFIGTEVMAVGNTPEIVWTFPCDSNLKDIDKVTDEINKYIKPKIGATLKLKPVGWDKWFSPEAQNSAYDIRFTSYWSNFESDVVKGKYLALETLADKYLPKSKMLIGNNLLKGATRTRSLYALPVIRDNVYVPGVKLRSDLVKKYKIDIKKIKKLQDLEPILKNIKAKEKNVHVMEIGDNYFNGFLNLDTLGEANMPGAISNEGNEMKVVDAFGLPQTKAFFKTLYSFRKAGYIFDSQDIGHDESQGTVFAILKGRMPLFDYRFEYTKKGLEWVNIPLAKAYAYTDSATGDMNAVSADSKYPEKAMALLELVNTDKYVNNLLNFGIEGTHYVKKSTDVIDFPKGVNSRNSGYFSDLRWLFGNMYLNYTWSFEDAAMLQKMKALNDSANPSKGLGFWFNSSTIQSKVDSCTSIFNNEISGLSNGTIDPEKKIPELIDKLKKAGAKDVIDEKQRQLDAWTEITNITKLNGAIQQDVGAINNYGAWWGENIPKLASSQGKLFTAALDDRVVPVRATLFQADRGGIWKEGVSFRSSRFPNIMVDPEGYVNVVAFEPYDEDSDQINNKLHQGRIFHLKFKQKLTVSGDYEKTYLTPDYRNQPITLENNATVYLGASMGKDGTILAAYTNSVIWNGPGQHSLGARIFDPETGIWSYETVAQNMKARYGYPLTFVSDKYYHVCAIEDDYDLDVSNNNITYRFGAVKHFQRLKSGGPWTETTLLDFNKPEISKALIQGANLRLMDLHVDSKGKIYVTIHYNCDYDGKSLGGSWFMRSLCYYKDESKSQWTNKRITTSNSISWAKIWEREDGKIFFTCVSEGLVYIVPEGTDKMYMIAKLDTKNDPNYEMFNACARNGSEKGKNLDMILLPDNRVGKTLSVKVDIK